MSTFENLVPENGNKKNNNYGKRNINFVSFMNELIVLALLYTRSGHSSLCFNLFWDKRPPFWEIGVIRRKAVAEILP